MTEEQTERFLALVERGVLALESRCSVQPESGLLEAIHSYLGTAQFSSRALVDVCDVETDLREAILDEIGSLSPRSLGKRLARIEGRSLGGYVVRRAGIGGEGLEWRVEFA
jgi:hypothetical protein